MSAPTRIVRDNDKGAEIHASECLALCATRLAAIPRCRQTTPFGSMNGSQAMFQCRGRKTLHRVDTSRPKLCRRNFPGLNVPFLHTEVAPILSPPDFWCEKQRSF